MIIVFKKEIDMFTLKQYDTALISFEIIDDTLDGQVCHIIKVYEEKKYLFPIGLKANERSLMSWLCSRIIPKNREYVDAFLAKNGLSHNDTRGILKVCLGLSLNDSYWVTEDSFDGHFTNFNLYENDFVKKLSLIAYTGYGSSRAKGFSSSPEFTTDGMLRKGWRRIDGKTYLFKGGTSGASNTGNEPYSEYYASQIAEKMQIEHVHYELAMWKRSLCSKCELFTDIGHSYVPIYKFVDECTLRNVAVFLKGLGNSYYESFVDMLVFDAVICNEDRHFGNFGLIVDNKTNKPIKFAPIFDHGLSLFNYGTSSDFDNLNEYSKTRSSSYGVPFKNIVKEFITLRQKEKLRKLIGFKFIKDKNYNLPSKRLKSIELWLQSRIQDLLNI